MRYDNIGSYLMAGRWVAMFRRCGAGVGVCFAGVVFLAGCGSDGTSGPSPAEATPVEGASSSTAQELGIPDAVIVCQPGMVDTTATVDDVPEWPGPLPLEFMEPSFPSGSCGTLTGQEARVVYEAAVEHPASLLEEGRLEEGGDLVDTTDALWALEGVVAWLVVEPQW